MVQCGILIYVTARRATMHKIDAKINGILRVIFFYSKVCNSLWWETESKFFSFTNTQFLNWWLDEWDVKILSWTWIISLHKMNCQDCARAKNNLNLSPLIHFSPKTVYQIKSENSNVFLKLDSNFVTKVKNLRGPQFKTFAHEKIEN